MKERREQKPQTYFGIRLSDITNEMLKDIVDIYLETGGGYPASFVKVRKEEVLQELGKGWGYIERRFGSRFTGNSKLHIKPAYTSEIRGLIKFEAYANVHGEHLSSSEMKEARQWEENFKRAASKYLENSGRGIPIPESSY